MVHRAAIARLALDVWLTRIRFALATAVVWAGLHYLLSGYVLPRGLDRPLVLVAAPAGLPAGLLFVLVIWAAAVLASVIGGLGDGRRPLMVIGLALALWAFERDGRGGTMDSWLLLCHERPGPPTSEPYLRLLPDYAYLLVAVGGAWYLVRMLRRRGWGGTSAPSQSPAGVARGLSALLVATAITGVGMFFLTGPAVGATWRGQVYFAVALSTLAGTYFAARLTGVRHPAWYWPVPFVVGVIGLAVAAANPALLLPPAYRGLDTIPAWGLARALPVELVGVGLMGGLWVLGRRATPGTSAGEPG